VNTIQLRMDSDNLNDDGFRLSFTSQSGVSTGSTGVPEPTTWAMMGLGFAGLGLAGFRASRKSARHAVV